MLLDEATSSVDHATDAFIQDTIRSAFGDGTTTVLAIAHRLDTILDADRVLVMHDGKVGEYDTPARLLTLQPFGLFSQLIDAEVREQQEQIRESEIEQQHQEQMSQQDVKRCKKV